MQRLIQRAEVAKRTAARRAKKQQEYKLYGEAWERTQTRVRMTRATNEQIRQSRKHRAIDWDAGALAPRRDVGDQKDTYGALPVYNFHLPEKEPKQKPSWVHIAVGDRVVVTRGADRGKIGSVEEYDADRVAVKVKGLNQADVQIPTWLARQSGGTTNVVTAHLMIDLRDVKLVYPLPDPKTGVLRDVIIDRLQPINRRRDRNTRERSMEERIIPGTNILIPWPEHVDPEPDVCDDDTVRIEVDDVTFRPFLLRPPMPLSVIDELRNKYGKFRTRHDYEYRLKKEAEDAKAEGRKDLIKTMRTPLQQLAEVRAQQKKAQEKDLTPEQLAKIGEVIAQERQKAVSAAQAFEQ